ncbi:hypothetical protein DW083_05970 [Parabacteroides sp. AF48-14]|uniref:hypothetical protein n=1 Tax=Parabacteroides sp. AF48-14 TaxID=2292052 RepID=UPI000EFFEEF9|nr:hypothetical protein [Parabacteroides sp. AF48-14]RHO73391.1 hypothetical protein DW083_05970 [Parabacteroides sp. AF48-14]
MELKDFIKETLVQIAQGIEEAQVELAETDCIINPRDIKEDGFANVIIKNKRHTVQCVDFNIALTSTSESADKAGIGVMLGSFGIGGNRTSSDGSTSNTSISFSVPVVFPSIDNENKPVSRSIRTITPRSSRRL